MGKDEGDVEAIERLKESGGETEGERRSGGEKMEK